MFGENYEYTYPSKCKECKSFYRGHNGKVCCNRCGCEAKDKEVKMMYGATQ